MTQNANFLVGAVKHFYFNLEQLPEFQEMLNERNKVTGISGLFQKGGYYGRLEGLL